MDLTEYQYVESDRGDLCREPPSVASQCAGNVCVKQFLITLHIHLYFLDSIEIT